LAYHTLAPLFKYGSPVIIDRAFSITQEDSPVLFVICELAVSIIELLVMMPIETIRRRLQGQSQPSILITKFETVVGVSPIAYSGPFDCLWRIIRQEGVRGRRFRALYKGIKMRFLANGLIALLKLMMNIDEE
jgi:mitochondrial fusion and transport protein UGO1